MTDPRAELREKVAARRSPITPFIAGCLFSLAFQTLTGKTVCPSCEQWAHDAGLFVRALVRGDTP